LPFATTTAARATWRHKEFTGLTSSSIRTPIRAGNSYFYLAELQFRAANYKQAVANYDQVLQNFPSGTKAAAGS